MRTSVLSAAFAALATLSLPALADSTAKQAKQQKHTQPASAPQNDHVYASHLAHHHRDGIAMADAVIANGASDEVEAIARRIKASQQRDIPTLEAHKPEAKTKAMMPPTDPDMKRGMARLKAAKGAEADALFLELMMAHHASGLTMTHSAMHHLDDVELRSLAEKTIASQAREIGELQRLRESNRSASR